jgi:hypothetical protein
LIFHPIGPTDLHLSPVPHFKTAIQKLMKIHLTFLTLLRVNKDAVFLRLFVANALRIGLCKPVSESTFATGEMTITSFRLLQM